MQNISNFRAFEGSVSACILRISSKGSTISHVMLIRTNFCCALLSIFHQMGSYSTDQTLFLSLDFETTYNYFKFSETVIPHFQWLLLPEQQHLVLTSVFSFRCSQWFVRDFHSQRSTSDLILERTGLQKNGEIFKSRNEASFCLPGSRKDKHKITIYWKIWI